MQGVAQSAQKEIVFHLPIDDVRPDLEELIGQLESVRDEIKSYAERIETALAGEQLFWTEEDLALKFECSVLTIQRTRRDGKIKFKRLPGGQAVFTRQHIEEFLSS
jgi:hypothetical protein